MKSCTGPLSYKTALAQGQTVKRHVDKIRARSTDKMLETVTTENEQDRGTSALSSADVAVAPADKEMSALEKGRSQEVTAVEKNN